MKTVHLFRLETIQLAWTPSVDSLCGVCWERDSWREFDGRKMNAPSQVLLGGELVDMLNLHHQELIKAPVKATKKHGTNKS